MLVEHGWNTYHVGKWHLCAEDEMNLASSKRQWPLGRGFERYYGFLGGETNQWYPDLVYDNHPVSPPRTPEEGYHLTVDLTDKAIEFVQDAKAIAPDKPFFLYYCPGAAHAPHHAPKEWIDKYKGKFDMGYEAYREGVFERQKQLGIISEQAELSPINPYADTTSHDGKPWSMTDRVLPWDSLPEDEKVLFRRMAEVYAGFLSHADHEFGRLLDYLDESGQLDNTIIVLVSDNGASGEGGPQRLRQREQVLQRRPRHPRGKPRPARRSGQPADLQPLSDRVGVGLQHAVQDVEALRQLRGRHGRSDAGLVAQGHRRFGRDSPSVHPRRRHRAHSAGAARPGDAGRGQRLHPAPGRRYELRAGAGRR